MSSYLDHAFQELPKFTLAGREVSLTELIRMKVQQRVRHKEANELWAIFRRIDRDGSGDIGPQEMSSFLSHFHIELSSDQVSLRLSFIGYAESSRSTRPIIMSRFYNCVMPVI